MHLPKRPHRPAPGRGKGQRHRGRSASPRAGRPPLCPPPWHRAADVGLGLALLAGLVACSSKTGPGSGAPPPPAGAAGAVQFLNGAAAAGLTHRHTDGSSGMYYIVETLASGVIIFDFDLDGDPDIYFPNGRPLPPTPQGNASTSNFLYRNEGSRHFTDVTKEKGVPGTGFGTGGAAADYDNDGDLDLYVCQYGPNVLYRNEGKSSGFSFRDVTPEAHCDDPRFSAGACFFDFDHDGDLDLYVTNYCKDDLSQKTPFKEGSSPRYFAPSHYAPDGDSFFRNLGNGSFENATEAVGISKIPPGRGMGIVATDFNRDGWLDLYVANDGSENFLLRNEQGKTFVDIGMTSGTALNADGDETGSMGVDSGDPDRDGKLDLIVTNYQKQLNSLYLSSGAELFADAAMRQGLGETCLPMVSWGVKFFDYDNDGWQDVFIANGHLEDHISEYDNSSSYKQQNQLFHNLGKGTFREVSAQSGPAFEERHSNRGAAFGDLDGDGDVDIVVVSSREPPSLLWNEGGNQRSWVLLELEGQGNHFAIGAFVRVVAGGVSQIAEVRTSSSYISQNDLRLHFGLDQATVVDSVEIDWPSGKKEVFRSLPARKVHHLVEGSGAAR